MNGWDVVIALVIVVMLGVTVWVISGDDTIEVVDSEPDPPRVTPMRSPFDQDRQP